MKVFLLFEIYLQYFVEFCSSLLQLLLDIITSANFHYTV